ncbi:MAG: hypothetical protein JRD04_09515 [Deltaproteobacteria bacterium]|nr:hypothetical protein [Deltaproteobacteria bacterium]
MKISSRLSTILKISLSAPPLFPVSYTVLKDELIDIQEVIMIYSSTDAERKITERSAVQEKLWKIFELEKIENQLSLHK